MTFTKKTVIALCLCFGLVAAYAQGQGSANTTDKAKAPAVTVALIGDSTVSAYKEDSLLRGWGQFLADGLAPSVKVANYARSGASTKTFSRATWERILKSKPDYVLIQFGHNDSHAKGKPESTDAATDYRDNLREFIDQAREAGAEPILVTSVHRRRYLPNGKVTQELLPYVDAMKAVAEEKQVGLIDLHTASGELFERLGDEGTENFTVNRRINPDLKGKGDLTHFTEEGAKAVAALVAEGLTALEPSLARE